MTSIRFSRDKSGRLSGFTVVGHTGYAPEGEDIVCAGVSALSQTAVIIRSGFLSARLPRGLRAKQRYEAQIILRSVRQGLEDIAKAYPGLVKVS